MAYIAAERLAYVFPHLAGGLALDLGSRAVAVERWFGGAGLYGHNSSTYPPASYLLLWPMLGWLPFHLASQGWAWGCALSLGWLALLCVRHEAIGSHSARWLGAMTMLALTATSAVVWLGQLTSLVMAAILGAMFLLYPAHKTEVGPLREVAAGALLLFSLVKPSVAAPFLWMVLWAPARWRVGLGVVAGYGVLTLAALWFQHDAPAEVAMWAQTVNRNNAQLSEGYANSRAWLAMAGLKGWSHPFALVALLVLGVWTHRQRHLDRLLLLSVTALVARLWTYHNLYDDLLLAIPMLLLLQISLDANAPNAARIWQARALLAALVGLLLLPPDWMFHASIYGTVARAAFGLTLALLLLFLLRLARVWNAEAERGAR